MNVYNTKEGVLLIILLFLVYIFLVSQMCPCNNNNYLCTRKEFFGIQFNHIIFFIFLGYYFPSYFYTFQIFGISFELLQIYFDKYPNILFYNISGCLKNPPLNYREEDNKIYNYRVYKGIKKPLNIIDEIFEIENSTISLWHGSIAEIIANIIAFKIGYLLNTYLKK